VPGTPTGSERGSCRPRVRGRVAYCPVAEGAHEDHRRVQRQGWGRQDHHRGQPCVRGRRLRLRLLWDLDPQGGATYLMQVKPKLRGGAEALITGRTPVRGAVRQSGWETLDVLPADATYRELELALDGAKKSERRVELTLAGLDGEYDYAVLDCPPGSSVLARNVLRAADLVVVPLVPSALAMRSLDQVIELVEDGDRPPRCSPSSPRWTGGRRAPRAGRAAAGRATRDRGRHGTGERRGRTDGDHRAPLGSFASSTPAGAAYAALWRRVEKTARKTKAETRPSPVPGHRGETPSSYPATRRSARTGSTRGNAMSTAVLVMIDHPSATEPVGPAFRLVPAGSPRLLVTDARRPGATASSRPPRCATASCSPPSGT